MSLRFLVYAMFPMGLAFAFVGGCNRSAPAAGFQMPPPGVTTASVMVADVPVYLDEIGRTRASEVVTITPQVSGKITQKFFEDGADLSQDQKLFIIDPLPFQYALDSANASQQLANAQLHNAQTDFTRVSSLLATKAVAQQDFDTAQNAVKVAEAQVNAAKAQVESAQWNLDRCTVTAPSDGRAGQRLVDAGNIVTANSTALLTIQKNSPIFIDFTIPENSLDEVRNDMNQHTLKVIVHTPDNPNQSGEANLTFLDNAVQDGTGTIKLHATLENKNHWVWPGQFVQVRLILRTLTHAMLIPNEAIQVGQMGQYVFVIREDPTTHKTIAEQKSVTVGQRQGDLVVITAGLDPTDTIVQTGQLAVVPGGAVTVRPSATQPAGAAPAAAASSASQQSGGTR